MGHRTVLISGASIAGPALAYWLHRHGFTVTVVEQSATLRPGGQAVDLRGVGRDVVERMGLMASVRGATVDERLNGQVWVTVIATGLGGSQRRSFTPSFAAAGAGTRSSRSSDDSELPSFLQ